MPPDPDTDDGEALYVANAGLVLFAPYLPMLFDRLGLISRTEGGHPQILGIDAQSRAVHLLQYLVDARLDCPEPMLALNKLLSGVPIGQPIAPGIVPTQADLDICDELIAAVIANWRVVANSTPATLRETFLQREGRLQHPDSRRVLRVQRKAVDVLVAQLPWRIDLIGHPWMAEPLHVTW